MTTLIQRLFKISPALALIGLTGCASLNSVSVTPVPANRKNVVTAEADRWIILGLNFDNDYVDTVSKELADKCRDGKVSGILTKDQTFYYFLFFVLKRNVTATGYCEKKATVAHSGVR
jgi:hypothetical protein